MNDAPSGPNQELDGMAQESVGRHAAPLRIGRREMLADVAGADRAQQRIGQRMQGYVGVGMTGQPLDVWNGNAAQHHLVAGGEAMHVEAEGGARFHRRNHVVGRGDLAVVVVPLDHHDTQSGAFGDGRIVGEGARLMRGERCRGPVCGEQLGEAEDLRRLGAPQAAARNRPDQDTAIVDLFQGVSDWYAEDGPIDARTQGLEAAENVRHAHVRPGSVVDGNEVS